MESDMKVGRCVMGNGVKGVSSESKMRPGSGWQIKGESAAQNDEAFGTGRSESYLQGQGLPSHVL